MLSDNGLLLGPHQGSEIRHVDDLWGRNVKLD